MKGSTNNAAQLDNLIRETFHMESTRDIDGTTGPGDLYEWDSVGHIRLMTAIEETYSITLNIDEMLEIDSVDSIRHLLATKGIQQEELNDTTGNRHLQNR